MNGLRRSSGILLHPTSLPGTRGTGELGQAARDWIDFLADAGQSIWQILPLGPTGYGNSPYSSLSVFAGNPLLIDIDWLLEHNLLDHSELLDVPSFPEGEVAFETVIPWKVNLLMKCYQRCLANADRQMLSDFTRFCKTHDQVWLDDFALFISLKYRFEEQSWHTWSEDIRKREQAAMTRWREKLENEIEAHKFLQFVFFEQWAEVKSYANSKGINILGDIPIYVTFDSADVWANQELFYLGSDSQPTEVAGVPPDYFSATGQLWGNPIYRWDLMKSNGFKWWLERVRMIKQTADWIRLDHFRGFESYWSVPFGEDTAINGKWKKGPGAALFKVFEDEFGQLPIIAEDLGFITSKVEKLRDRFAYPGMKILQFAFADDSANEYLPHNYTPNSVVYTGSHDNDTTHGWFNSAEPEEKTRCLEYIGQYHGDIAHNLMRVAAASVATVCVFPVQDVLQLGSEARMNTPGVASGNWSWQLQSEQLQPHHAEFLQELTERYGRIAESPEVAAARPVSVHRGVEEEV